METNIKNAVKSMREEIATLEKTQKTTKEQRKTVNFPKGKERTMPAWVATDKARILSRELRIRYAAYGLLRGKSFDEIESRAKPVDRQYYWMTYGLTPRPEFEGKHPLCLFLSEIDSYLQEYGFGLPHETRENTWGQKYKVFNCENCEKAICLSEQTA